MADLTDKAQDKIEWLKNQQRQIIKDCERDIEMLQKNLADRQVEKADAEAVLAELEEKLPKKEK